MGAAEMLDFEEIRVFKPRLVDLERPHDAQGGGAFQGTDEARVPIQKTGLPRPILHLPGVQEKAAGVGVSGPAEEDSRAENISSQVGGPADVLKAGGTLRCEVSVQVHFLCRRIQRRFEAIRLKQLVVSPPL